MVVKKEKKRKVKQGEKRILYLGPSFTRENRPSECYLTVRDFAVIPH